MPGVGKTTWGRRLAEEYGLHFIDLDVYIEQQEKDSIPGLFTRYGEGGFRELEHNYLRKLIDDNDTIAVVACGGGTPCFYDNMDVMRSAGTVIYLVAGVQELSDNLEKSAEERPLLKGKDDLGRYLAELLEQRTVCYERADHILHTGDISVATFAEIFSS
jgi:shikimate kinase